VIFGKHIISWIEGNQERTGTEADDKVSGFTL